MNKEILDLIMQIERSDFKDRLGRELINDKAYINLVNKFKDSIDNIDDKIYSLCYATDTGIYPMPNCRCTIDIPETVKGVKEVDTLVMNLEVNTEQFENDMAKVNEIVDETIEQIDKLIKAALKTATKSTMSIEEAIAKVMRING